MAILKTRRNFLKTVAGSAATPLVLPSVALGKEEKWDMEADIVIVGTGAAGISAALSAWEYGAKNILLLEKMPWLGGASRFSGGYYNAVDPQRQNAQGIVDSIELHKKHTSYSARGKANPALIDTLCSNALDTLHWLEGFGARYTDKCAQIYGGFFPRSHVPVIWGPYDSYIDILIEKCVQRNIRIASSLPVKRILRSENRVYGVESVNSKGQTISVHARKALILAAGGFASNSRLCCTLNPRLKGLSCTNPPVTTGEVMMAALDIGAYAAGCDYIECVPTPMYFSRLGVFIDRCIFVDHQGKRFVREDDLRDTLRDCVLSLPNKYGYVVVDDDGYQQCPDAFRERVDEKLQTLEVFRAPTVEKLAERLRISPSVFAETIKTFNKYVTQKHDPDFGRDPQTLIYPIAKPPFWASVCRMSIHHTMGGLVINPQAQVLDWEDKVIPGLYAAGEITGGIHGANRLGGNAITDAHVFGRIAGRNAAGERS